VLLAVVNGQNLTTAEIDPHVREEVESLNDKIAEARRNIGTPGQHVVAPAEAARRKMTAQQLYDIEVKRKLTEPTTAEINKFIEDNRDSINQSDPDTMKKDVALICSAKKRRACLGSW